MSFVSPRREKLAAVDTLEAPLRHSIVIISYRRDDMLEQNLRHTSALVGNRRDVELVLVDNNEDARSRGDFLEGFARKRLVKAGTNRGVAGGRNLGMAAARGEFLVFLDDDAQVFPEDFLDRIESAFRKHPEVAILSFRSIDFFTGQVRDSEFPHTDKRRRRDLPFKTFRFIGVGHAIRASVLAEIGRYEEDFRYGCEEFDLSFRALEAGHQILYLPDVWVLHKQIAAGRLPPREVRELVLTNKLKVGFLHLPGPIFLTNALLWAGHTVLATRGRVGLGRVLRNFARWAKVNRRRRRPLSEAARRYVGAVGGSLWR